MMDRELKFRAWDKLNEVWVQIKSLNFWDDEGLWYLEDFDGEVYFADKKDWVILQYTGLKDKNGVEIYEGNIVRVTDDEGSTDFSDGGIGEVGGMDELLMWYIDGEVQNGLYDIETTAYIEVIGNIYENPELLDKHQ